MMLLLGSSGCAASQWVAWHKYLLHQVIMLKTASRKARNLLDVQDLASTAYKVFSDGKGTKFDHKITMLPHQQNSS